MTIIEALGKTTTGEKLRRKKDIGLIIAIDENQFVYDSDLDDKTPYNLTIEDLIADDWEYQKKEWKSK